MPDLVCSHGHRWQTPPGGDAAAPSKQLCPVCGAPAEPASAEGSGGGYAPEAAVEFGHRRRVLIAHTMHFAGDEVIELEDPTVDDVLRWIKELDGEKNTIVAVTLDDGSSAEVSGGSDGRYKVNARVNGRFFDLASGISTSYKRVPLAYCEDVCFYPEKYIVTLEQALASLRHFCLTGELCPEFSWSSASDYYPYEPETRAEGEPGAAPDGGGM